MKTRSRLFWIIVPLLFALGITTAHASTVEGIAVKTPGGGFLPGDKAGLTGDGPDLEDAIKYYIPLNGPGDPQYYGDTFDYTGTYGVAGTSPCLLGAGTCSDKGRGTGYGTVASPQADALKMNIFFDLSGEPASQSAKFLFDFDDLDLTPDNDPDAFFESISLSYWKSNAAGNNPANFSLVELASPMTDESELPASLEFIDNPNVITWELNLAALGDLNTSQANAGGFWIQFGFGSDFSGHKGRNTPEYLLASLHLTPVPVPAAVWLFGTALIGLIGFSKRRSVQA